MKVQFVLPFIFALSVSCSSIVHLINSEQKSVEIVPANAKVSCEANTALSIGSKSLQANTFLLDYLKRHPNISFKKAAAILALTQLYFRPETTTPGSRFYYLIVDKDKFQANDFNNLMEKNQSIKWPFLIGLQHLAGGVNPLLSLTRHIEGRLPDRIKVDQYLSHFLQENQSSPFFTQKKKALEGLFFRAGQPLNVGETFKRFQLLPFMKNNLQTGVSTKQFAPPLFPTSKKGLKCNLDFGLYDHQVVVNSKEWDSNFNIFSLIFKNKIFVGVTSNGPDFIKVNSPKGPLISKNALTPLSFCHQKNETSQMALFSLRGPDSGQILHQLTMDEAVIGHDKVSLIKLLKQARHIKTTNPSRYIFESQSLPSQEVDRILSTKLNPYHSRKIGEVWGLIWKNKESSLVIDERQPTHLLCD